MKVVEPAMVPRGSVITGETTASSFDSGAHHFWKDAVAGKNGYRAPFFPWWEGDPAHYRLPLLAPDELGALEEDEAALVRVHGLSLDSGARSRRACPITRSATRSRAGS